MREKICVGCRNQTNMSEETSVDMEVGEVNTSGLGVAWFFTSKGKELHLI